MSKEKRIYTKPKIGWCISTTKNLVILNAVKNLAFIDEGRKSPPTVRFRQILRDAQDDKSERRCLFANAQHQSTIGITRIFFAGRNRIVHTQAPLPDLALVYPVPAGKNP